MSIKFGRWFSDKGEPLAPVRIEFNLTRDDLIAAAALALYSDSGCNDEPAAGLVASITAARIEKELRWVLTDKGQGGLDYASDTVGYGRGWADNVNPYWTAAEVVVTRLWPNATKGAAA